MKHLMKRNNNEISDYLRDKQIECFTFNIIQHHPTAKAAFIMYYLGGEDLLGGYKNFQDEIGGLKIFN